MCVLFERLLLLERSEMGMAEWGCGIAIMKRVSLRLEMGCVPFWLEGWDWRVCGMGMKDGRICEGFRFFFGSRSRSSFLAFLGEAEKLGRNIF